MRATLLEWLTDPGFGGTVLSFIASVFAFIGGVLAQKAAKLGSKDVTKLQELHKDEVTEIVRNFKGTVQALRRP